MSRYSVFIFITIIGATPHGTTETKKAHKIIKQLTSVLTSRFYYREGNLYQTLLLFAAVFK